MGTQNFKIYALANSYQTKNNLLNNEPNGFVNRDDSVISFNESLRKFTIAPKITSYQIFSWGNLFTKDAAESIIIPDTEGRHFIYFDENGDLATGIDFDPQLIFGPWCFTSVIIWDAENQELPFGGIQNERHGLLDSRAHARWHNKTGLVITSGLALNTFNTEEDGSLLISNQFGMEAGIIADEDISMNVPPRISTVSPHVVYLLGANPDWRKGTPVAGTCLLVSGGILQYNKNDVGAFSLDDVPDGEYVNYHGFISTSDTPSKMEIWTPGHATYASKSEAIVAQLTEVLSLANSASETAIELAEYNFIGSILFKVDYSFTNSTKSVIVPISGGFDYNDFRDKQLGNGTINIGDPIVPVNLVREVTEDFSFTISDMVVHGNNNGKMIGVLPPIVSLDRLDIVWIACKISPDLFPVIISMVDPSDSQLGEKFHSFKLEKPGDALRITITEGGKYSLQLLPSAVDFIAQIEVATLKPTIATTNLTCNGDLIDISAEDVVNVSFKYREVGSLTWLTSTGADVTAEGTFQEIITVTAALDYEVQSVAEDITANIFLGDVKNTIANYYADIPAAKADSLIRYWDLQETSGIDTTGVEKLGSGEDMICSGGVTISSDVIDSRTIYKRVFGASDLMEAAFAFDNRSSQGQFSLLIQVDARTISGDHTIFSTGDNKLSLAPDGTQIQMSVNGGLQRWLSATPTGMINMLIRSNSAQNMIQLHTVTFNSITWRAQATGVMDALFDYLRMANGTNGDSNHQSGEYLANGDIRSIAFWDRSISDNEAMDIINTLDVKGMLIV